MGRHYNVAPRYTPGSPAMVSQEVAERVAKEEAAFIKTALSGRWGERHQARAARLGLSGIVELRVERRDHWEVTDLCTGARFRCLFPETLRKRGWIPFADLRSWEKKLVENDPPKETEDHTRAWFQIRVVPFDSFPTGHIIQVYTPEPLTTLGK